MNEKLLRNLTEEIGEVVDIDVATDWEFGRPRGFAFVEEVQGPRKAIGELHGCPAGGRQPNVNEARPRENRGGGGGRRNSHES